MKKSRPLAFLALVALVVASGQLLGARRADASGDSATATQVSAGEDHTCALLSNGTIECWGSGYIGQLGNGKKEDSTTPVAGRFVVSQGLIIGSLGTRPLIAKMLR